MDKKIILHVADKLSKGGATKHGVTQLLEWWFQEFDRSRFEVILCSLRGREKAGEFFENLGFKVVYLGRGKFDPRTLTDLLNLVRSEKVDVLHLHGYGAANFGRLVSLLSGKPVVVHEHITDPYMPGYQRIADRLLSAKTDYAIAVSESVKDFMVKDRGISPDLVEVVYNGARQKPLAPDAAAAARQGWRQRLGIPETSLVAATVGRLNTLKGHTYFLQAAQEVLQVCPDITFLVVGDGDLMETLKEQSRALGIAEQVVFMGYCDDVPSLMYAVDIKVISSLAEGVPLTLFEAMTAGCPVVSTDAGGIREVLPNGEAGFVTPLKDPQALAEKILLLAQDDRLRQQMGDAARQVALTHDVANNVRRFEAIYEQLAR
jgi:glycosyltransferase involved in cell wall biosynthesis